ncbi:hypothetical protein BJX76DRAFT_107323 [Aspergillus varians]
MMGRFVKQKPRDPGGFRVSRLQVPFTMAPLCSEITQTATLFLFMLVNSPSPRRSSVDLGLMGYSDIYPSYSVSPKTKEISKTLYTG